ncbi:helix-turn-helix domain-containing protein [Methylocapsa palsarum]|uniref:Helix-turn-helix domain-containing protein n=1 Tax=Methylocapsa palsarum TaxID=1612308 RepID=A0A1I4CDC5_9HYPH|nr:helix-turn-helix domain-containing protein [Methylocapsa palsarum]SFK79154.1 Helix-turn-helix domain-containing protein [Methylocapsa palsarum]
MSDFIRNKFLWLDQVAADGDLPPTVARLAIVLCRYFNRESGSAWPSIERLARDLGIADRSVQRMVKLLIEHGHLEVDSGGGRNKTNRYCQIIKTATELSPFDDENPDAAVTLSNEEPRQDCHPLTQERVTICVNKPRQDCHPNPLKEPFEKKDAGKPAISDFRKSSLEPISLVPAIPFIGRGAAEAEQLETAARGASDLEADLFRRGKEVLGTNAGGLIVKLLKAKGRNIALARAAIETASTKQSAREYVNGVIRGSPEAKTAADYKAEARARGDAW